MLAPNKHISSSPEEAEVIKWGRFPQGSRGDFITLSDSLSQHNIKRKKGREEENAVFHSEAGRPWLSGNDCVNSGAVSDPWLARRFIPSSGTLHKLSTPMSTSINCAVVSLSLLSSLIKSKAIAQIEPTHTARDAAKKLGGRTSNCLNNIRWFSVHNQNATNWQQWQLVRNGRVYWFCVQGFNLNLKNLMVIMEIGLVLMETIIVSTGMWNKPKHTTKRNAVMKKS